MYHLSKLFPFIDVPCIRHPDSFFIIPLFNGENLLLKKEESHKLQSNDQDLAELNSEMTTYYNKYQNGRRISGTGNEPPLVCGEIVVVKFNDERWYR